MQRRRVMVGILLLPLLVGSSGLYFSWWLHNRTPLDIVGQNILPNNDFTQNTSHSKIPDGWIPGTSGVEVRPDVRYDAGPSMQIQGISNYLKSPRVPACVGAKYSVAFRVLSHDAETRVRVMFHWQDAEDIEFMITKGSWQSVPVQQWKTISASATAPPSAKYVAISIHPASDDIIFVDDLYMGQSNGC